MASSAVSVCGGSAFNPQAVAEAAEQVGQQRGGDLAAGGEVQRLLNLLNRAQGVRIEAAAALILRQVAQILQARLEDLGYLTKNQCSGRFDADTLRAVQQIQQALNLTPSGEVSPALLSYLLSSFSDGLRVES